jgi:hypothetical protein
MSVEDFEHLICIAGLVVKHTHTHTHNYRNATRVTICLSITLRFLATGNSCRSLIHLLKFPSRSLAQQPNVGHGRLILRFLDHRQWHTTVDRTSLDEWSVRRRDFYLTTHTTLTRDRHPCPRRDFIVLFCLCVYPYFCVLIILACAFCPYCTTHTQNTNIHGPCEIRTCNLSKRSASDPRRWPLGHSDRHKFK